MKLILFVVLGILLAAAANAEVYAYMEFNYTLENPDLGNELSNIKDLRITEIFTIEDTYWNDHYFSSSFGDAHDSYQLEIYDVSGSVLYDAPIFPQQGKALIEYEQGYYRFVIKDEGEIVLEKTVSFCNNNNVCQPCFDEDCRNSESVLTCLDCDSGSSDNYCDLYNDGVCDPDCYGADGDCRECGELCHYRDDEEIYTTCSGIYNGEICEPDEECTGTLGYANDSGYSCCMQGRCVEPTAGEYEIEGKSCPDFSWQECGAQKCDGEEVYLDHNGVTCCQGTCTENIDILDDTPLEGKEYPLLFAAIFILVIAIVLLVKKKKIIHISLFILIFIAGLPFVSPAESQAVQMQKICEVSEAYNIPAPTLLAVAYKESGIQHYNSDGSVKISGDGGVGIMQRQWGGSPNKVPDKLYICHGNSAIDGRQLDALKLDDNIECGAIELWRKCDQLNCMANTKEYYCPNTGNPLPEKRVTYSDWDIALRAYNGWGCEAPYYRDMWGAGSQKYINLISRVQSYVESFHEAEEQFEGLCDGASSGGSVGDTAPGQDTGQDIPLEIVEGDSLGLYYINPSFRVQSEIEFLDIYDEIAYSSRLIEEALGYIEDGSTVDSAVDRALSSRSSWKLDSCAGNQCSFIVDTGYSIFAFDGVTYEERPIELKFALTIAESGIREFPDFRYDELPFEEDSDLAEAEEEEGQNTGADVPREIPEGVLSGIDVSHWQGNIDWSQISGQNFVFIKATEGTGFVDNKFHYNIRGATENGIIAGAYHFARPLRYSGSAEARHFANVVGPYLKRGYLRPVLDLETGGPELGRAVLSSWVHEFIREFRDITGVEPLIYANSNYVRNYLDSSIDQYDLWVAHYGVSQPGVTRYWDFWQYTDRGRISGITSNSVDLNYFRGDAELLRERFEIV